MENSRFFFQLKQVMDGSCAWANTLLSQYDVTFSQLRVLHVLIRYGGACTQQVIERELHASHPTVLGLISRLEKSGFVEYRWETTPRKRKIICMTEKAEKLERAVDENRNDLEEHLLDGISKEEREILRHLLDRIAKNLQTEAQGGTCTC